MEETIPFPQQPSKTVEQESAEFLELLLRGRTAVETDEDE
jgi:hypothetical protein